MVLDVFTFTKLMRQNLYDKTLYLFDMSSFVYIVNSLPENPLPMSYENIGMVFVCNNLSSTRNT